LVGDLLLAGTRLRSLKEKSVINYFSPRGAMRGIVLAAATATALLWACWAIGYVQGFSGVSAPEVIWILN
jgi:hypothetical protein